MLHTAAIAAGCSAGGRAFLRRNSCRDERRGTVRLKLKNLHHRAARECVDDGPGRRFDDDSRFPHPAAGQPLDFLAQLVAGDGEEGPVILLHLRRASSS